LRGGDNGADGPHAGNGNGAGPPAAWILPPIEEPVSLEELERMYLRRVLDHTRWRIEGPRGAAAILGLNPSTLRSRLRKLGIDRQIQHV
jgi:DNA-binding NtrC family response regulator